MSNWGAGVLDDSYQGELGSFLLCLNCNQAGGILPQSDGKMKEINIRRDEAIKLRERLDLCQNQAQIRNF